MAGHESMHTFKENVMLNYQNSKEVETKPNMVKSEILWELWGNKILK